MVSLNNALNFFLQIFAYTPRFPLEDSENNKKIGDESDPNQETNQKENDSDAHSTTPCYETDNFTIAGPCAPCQPFHSVSSS